MLLVGTKLREFLRRGAPTGRHTIINWKGTKNDYRKVEPGENEARYRCWPSTYVSCVGVLSVGSHDRI